MKPFARIQFSSTDEFTRALYGLMQRGRIVGLRDRVLIVPAAALDWLQDQGISYQLLESLNQDDVVQTVRDTLAHPV